MVKGFGFLRKSTSEQDWRQSLRFIWMARTVLPILHLQTMAPPLLPRSQDMRLHQSTMPNQSLAFWRSKSLMDKVSKGDRNVCVRVSLTCTKLYLPSLSQSHCHLPIPNYSTNEHIQIRYVNTWTLLLYHFSSHLLGYHMPVYFIVRAILRLSLNVEGSLCDPTVMCLSYVSCWSRFKNS